MLKHLVAALSLLSFFAAASEAVAQAAKAEKIEIATQSPTNHEFLVGKVGGKPAKIYGELRIPSGVKGKAPVVLLVHGSGGVGANIQYWVYELNKLGIATFAIDSFTGRGVKDTIADQTRVSNFAMLYDAHRAMEILSKHPGVDPDRIAIMGFSKGAVVALYASMARFQEKYLDKSVKFAAHIPFYSACNTEFIGDTKLSGAPLRFFHGAADNYTPVSQCKEYIARLKSAGVDVELTEFPGVHHSFDNPRIAAPLYLPQALTGRKCALEEKSEGVVISKTTGKPFTAKDPCIERGATIAYSPAATAASNKQVAAFLKDVFKPK